MLLSQRISISVLLLIYCAGYISSRGNFSGVGDIHFFYSADEVLYGALPDFEAACKCAKVPYTAFDRPKMICSII